MSESHEEELDFADVRKECGSVKDKIRSLTKAHSGITIPDVKTPGAQLSKVGLFYVAISKLIDMLKKCKSVAKQFLTQNLPPEGSLKVGGFAIKRSKLMLELDKEAWEKRLETDREVLSAVTKEKHWKKEVKKLKDETSTLSATRITWKVDD